MHEVMTMPRIRVRMPILASPATRMVATSPARHGLVAAGVGGGAAVHGGREGAASATTALAKDLAKDPEKAVHQAAVTGRCRSEPELRERSR